MNREFNWEPHISLYYSLVSPHSPPFERESMKTGKGSEEENKDYQRIGNPKMNIG